jgi:cytochrome c556
MLIKNPENGILRDAVEGEDIDSIIAIIEDRKPFSAQAFTDALATLDNQGRACHIRPSRGIKSSKGIHYVKRSESSGKAW